MAKRPVYTDKFRASAVIMLQAAGWPNTPGASEKVAKTIKVPRRTVERWGKKEMAPPPDVIVHDKKRDMIADLEELRFLLLGHMKETYEEASFQQLATGYGILTDKQRLLTGESTDNNATEILIRYASQDN